MSCIFRYSSFLSSGSTGSSGVSSATGVLTPTVAWLALWSGVQNGVVMPRRLPVRGSQVVGQEGEQLFDT